jgi:hypothetical protein
VLRIDGTGIVGERWCCMLWSQGLQCPFNNLESEHFSATSGGLYSLVGSGDENGGGGASTVHEMGVADSHVGEFGIKCMLCRAVFAYSEYTR